MAELALVKIGGRVFNLAAIPYFKLSGDGVTVRMPDGQEEVLTGPEADALREKLEADATDLGQSGPLLVLSSHATGPGDLNQPPEELFAEISPGE